MTIAQESNSGALASGGTVVVVVAGTVVGGVVVTETGGAKDSDVLVVGSTADDEQADSVRRTARKSERFIRIERYRAGGRFPTFLNRVLMGSRRSGRALRLRVK